MVARRHQPISRLPEKPAEGSWPAAWVRLHSNIKDLLQLYPDSGHAEALAMRFYSMVNTKWTDVDGQSLLSELEADVRRFRTSSASSQVGTASLVDTQMHD